ncbi:MAG: Maf family nucleotide pyrophosphatase [Pseudomonadota bacterium]
MSAKLILASQSLIRGAMLKNVGLEYEAYASNIDEKIVKESMLKEKATPEQVALSLAEFKARTITSQHQNAFVIGCDQILEMDGTIYDKVNNVNELRNRLVELSGRSHQLISAVCVVQDDQLLWHYVDKNKVSLRQLTDDTINQYIGKAPEDIFDCVGGYQIEGMGLQLIERVEGDYFSALGMPMLPLLAFLRNHLETILK